MFLYDLLSYNDVVLQYNLISAWKTMTIDKIFHLYIFSVVVFNKNPFIYLPS